MACGSCGGGMKGFKSVRTRPLYAPQGVAVKPKGLTPTEKRALEAQAAAVQPGETGTMTAARREIERKRRLAIAKTLGR